jgi:hypothetical protein
VSTGFLAVFALCGCGGGGGAGTPANTTKDVPGTAPIAPITAPITDSGIKSFVPNYRTELLAARRWDKNVLTVGYTAPLDAAGNARNMGPVVQQAIDLWNSKVSQGIRFQLTDSTNADIKIRWVTTGSLPSDAIGRTEVRFRNIDQILISAAVSIEQSLPDAFQVQVLAHELGHSMGIEGHSRVQSDVMYANAHLPAEITTRDQNTILDMYYSEGARSVQSGVSDGTTSIAASAAQYSCGSHSTHSH